MKYLSDGTWFDKGTEAKLIIDMDDCGLFEGIRFGKIDQEICGIDEFIKTNKKEITNEI